MSLRSWSVQVRKGVGIFCRNSVNMSCAGFRDFQRAMHIHTQVRIRLSSIVLQFLFAANWLSRHVFASISSIFCSSACFGFRLAITNWTSFCSLEVLCPQHGVELLHPHCVTRYCIYGGREIDFVLVWFLWRLQFLILRSIGWRKEWFLIHIVYFNKGLLILWEEAIDIQSASQSSVNYIKRG